MNINQLFERKKSLKNPQDNPCWDGYKPVGTKKKAGKTVPNCVPESEQSVAEARDGDTNFGSTVTPGTWVVHKNGKLLKRFKTHTGAKAYAEKNGGKVASSEFYADKIQKQSVAEAQTDYQKRRQREKDIDAGRPVKPLPKNPQNDYFARRKKQKEESVAESLRTGE